MPILEFFGSLDDIADAKAEILEGASGSTPCWWPTPDDERIMGEDHRICRAAGDVRHRASPAAVRAAAIVNRGVEGTTAHGSPRRGEQFDIDDAAGRAGQPGERAGRDRRWRYELDVPLEGNTPGAQQRLGPAARRGQIIRLPGAIAVITDINNANPTATRQALDVLADDDR